MKTPLARLLDLMAGWSDFVQRPHAAPDDEAVVDAICDLYQEAGNLHVASGRADDPATREALRAFLLDRVLPVLMHS